MTVSEPLLGVAQKEGDTCARARGKPTRRFEAAALDGLEILLVRLARACGGALATLLLASQYWLLNGAHWPGVWLVGLALVCSMSLLPVRGYKGFAKHDVRALRIVYAVLGSVLVTLFIVLFMWVGNLPLLPAVMYLELTLALVLLWLLAGWVVDKLTRGWDRKVRLVIVGAGEQGVAISRYMTEHESGIEVIGFIDDRQSRIDCSNLPFPMLAGGTAQLEQLPADVDGVVIALPNQAGDRVSSLATRLRGQLGNVYLAPDEPVLGHAFVNRPTQGPGNMLLLGMNPLPIEARLIKRVFDITFAFCVLTLFLPLGLIIAALIRLESPGPVLFTQKRYGLRNCMFDIYKFRSMRFDADSASKAINLTQRTDSRVTRVGNFLRRTSLDEFPQFINVLLGHMSVIGPRPHPPGVMAGDRTYETVIVDFVERYKVRPGITGWAQVNGLRGNTFTEESLTERFVYDVQYIENWSPELDLWIVFKTMFGGFGGANAF